MKARGRERQVVKRKGCNKRERKGRSSSEERKLSKKWKYQEEVRTERPMLGQMIRRRRLWV